MTKKYTPPFPRLGEVLRAIVGALDTKNNSRKIDEFAVNKDVNWHLSKDIILENIYQPLKKNTDEEFANFVAGSCEFLVDSYVALICNVSADNLNRNEIAPLLLKDYFAGLGNEFLSQLIIEFEGPMITELLNSNQTAFKAVFNHFLKIKENSIATLIYPESAGDGKTQRDNLNRWINGQQLPDSSSLRNLMTDVCRVSVGSNLTQLTRWLTIARAIEWLNQKNVQTKTCTLAYEFDRNLLPRIDTSIRNIQSKKSKELLPLIEHALILNHHLKRTTQKKPGDRADSLNFLNIFDCLITQYDPNMNALYWSEWHRGRWHILNAEYKEALPHFEQAFNLALYRAGENQSVILNEALMLAGYLKDASLTKKFKQFAITFNLNLSPRNPESSVIEDWEYEDLKRRFVDYFPPRGHFIEASEEKIASQRLPFLLYDENDPAKIRPDLRNPNREITLAAADGQKRKQPQLRFFAGEGNTQAVAELLKAGASVDNLDKSNSSALLCSLQRAIDGDRSCLDLLITYKHKTSTLDAITRKKRLSVLSLAVELGAPDVMKRLLEMGASVDQRSDLDEKTPLYKCIEQIGLLNGEKHKQLLTQKIVGARVGNLDLHQHDGLRRYGVGSINALRSDGNSSSSLLNGLMVQENENIATNLISNETSNWELTKLIDITETLLEFGADPNAFHHYPIGSYTLLMAAAEIDCEALFQALIFSGGDPYLRDSLGRNSLDIAREFQCFNVLEHFLFRLH